MKEDIDKDWEEIQDKIQGDVEEGFYDISKIIGSEDMDSIAAFYFLMFWTRVIIRYGKNGEKHDNKNLINLLKKMMDGNLPQDKGKIFDRRINN
jgi:hypothetical protein